MRISDFRVYMLVVLSGMGLLAVPSTAAAQFRPPPPETVGEAYHIEAAYGWWDADPDLIVNSESLGILGSDIDLISDLGIEQHKLGKFDLILRPAKKHRFRYQHLPIKYSTDAYRVTREFVFNGQRYTVGLPVTTTVDFTTDSFAYEYDFLYFPRGFVGASVGVKLANIDVDLQSPIGAEFFKHAAPIPTVGFAGRGYVTKSFAVNGEIAFFRIPDNFREQLDGDGSYTDIDFHGTYNFTKYLGAQAGWRKTTIFYEADRDSGDLKFTGFYFGGVVRY